MIELISLAGIGGIFGLLLMVFGMLYLVWITRDGDGHRAGNLGGDGDDESGLTVR